jgi:ABC-type transport system involved in multi-copper enzyme maturation permease subunit
MSGMMLPAVLPWVRQWATPVWLLSMGVTVGLLVLALAWLIVSVANRRWAAEIREALNEGVLLPLLWIGGALGIFAVIGVFLAEEPKSVALSLQRIPAVGTHELQFTLPASAERAKDEFAVVPFETLAMDFRRDEVRTMAFLSDQNIEVRSVSPTDAKEKFSGMKFDIAANARSVWNAPSQGISLALPTSEVKALYARNLGEKDAKLTVTIVTQPAVPQVWTIPMTAVAVIAIFLLYLAPRFAGPRLSAVSLATFKSQTAQPVFLILSSVGAVALIALLVWPFGTLGEDIKAMKKSGILVMLTAAMFQAIWAASTEIAEEIEGRTALTVLSKPLGRLSFIVGKFLGIFWTVGLLFTIHGLLFMILTAYKPVFEAKEGAQDATWQLCHLEMMSILPSLALAFMETIVLASISVAISTRLPMLANLIICFSIYVLGNLTPLIVQSGYGRFEIVQFFGKLIAVVFPNLENFNVEPAVSGGHLVPLSYLATTGVYASIYSLIALCLALILFEDRDVA